MLTKQIKDVIRQSVRAMGFELRRRTIQTSVDLQLEAILQTAKIDSVIDVGANEGQFATALRASGYHGRIISFEPLSAAHARLVRASAGDTRWEIAERLALGEHDGEVDIHVSANSYSSLILPMLARHATAPPDSAYVATERAEMRRLDAVFPGRVGAGAVVLLKIDTQGYEDRVLAGARETLKSVRALQLEPSLVPLYDGQVLFLDMVRSLEAGGFQLHALIPEFTDPATGQTLQINGILMRRV